MKQRPSDRPSTLNILVTGIGAIIGYGIIRSLRRSKYDCTIIGIDIYEDAVGQAWCDEFFQTPYAVDDHYLDFLSDLTESKNIDLVFFGTEQEIQRCSTHREKMDPALYKKLVINNPHLLELSHDKWGTHQALISHKLDHLAIPSTVEGDYESIASLWGNEFLLKPRRSYASKGIHIVHDAREFNFYKEGMGDGFMAQKLVGDIDHEYTVGVFGLGDGTHVGMIQMQRKLSQEGATAKANVIFNQHLTKAVNDLCATFAPLGPTNMQFRKDRDDFLLLEINPRISSSTSIRAAFGFNEAEMCIDYFIKDRMPVPHVEAGRALRFIDEIVTTT